MGKKRKVNTSSAVSRDPAKTEYDVAETFNDSEDEFYAGYDKILVEEEPAGKRQRLLAQRERNLQPSDEEILIYASDDAGTDINSLESDNAEDDGSQDGEEEQWGSTKADYYNADNIETEADALQEEAEARRLQQKQLKTMTMADFGVDETAWTMEHNAASSRPVVEKLPDIKIPAGAQVADKLNILSSRYPEFEPLAKDFLDLQEVWHTLRKPDIRDEGTEGVTTATKSKALATYLGAIAMYFAVLCTTIKPSTDELQITALPPADLRDHAVIQNLIRSRQLWDLVKNVEIVRRSIPEVPARVKSPIMNQAQKKGREKETPAFPASIKTVSAAEKVKPAKDNARAKNKLQDLQALISQPGDLQDDSDFGDEDPLTEEQASEKAKRKKSLRFYTSQIVQKANRRGAASRGAGGDDDVPHKERMRDRQDRLLKEAEKRGQQKATENEQLGNEDDGDIDVDDADEYYQSMVARSQQKKADKQARADAYSEAVRQGGRVYEEEVIGTDGKRAITYAIEKNKGLMPKRKKDVRNPRVKKRKKYDEKKKKLGSMRQVYKGGEGRGGYGGELTGIKTNVVKSVKL